MRMAARSKRSEVNEEENATLVTLMVEGDCVLLRAGLLRYTTARLMRYSQC